jgi:hypothetical protein
MRRERNTLTPDGVRALKGIIGSIVEEELDSN